jgi:acetyl esterase/lipase
MNRRDLLAGSVALAGLVSTPLRATGPEAASLPLHLVHPDLRPMVAQMEQMARSMPVMTRQSLPTMRQGGARWMRPPLADVPHEVRTVPVGRGHPDVAIAIINARPGTNRPAILHTHGGGYVMGSIKEAIRPMQEVAQALDCVIVSVDYRLAPETTYAGSIEDNYAGLKWLHGHAAELGADPAKIAVMGESAGGGHAALLAITARDRGEVPLVFQCLTYPMLDDRTGTSRPVPAHVGTLVWTPTSNRFGWESFLGTAPGRSKAPKGAVPARVADVKGLPPAFIGVGSLDLFLDEDVDYAQRLNAAGVSTELLLVPGAFHGFPMIGAATPLGRWFNTALLKALRRGFGMDAV